MPNDPLPDPRPCVPIRADGEPRTAWEHGTRFAGSEVLLSRLAGAAKIHVNEMVLPAGKTSFPFHHHKLEEEHFYVLNGKCVLRSGDDRHEMSAGDYACFPADCGVGHALENPFDADCTLLVIGSFEADEVIVYPDSGKAKVRRLDNAMIRWPQDTLDYWDGEDC